MKSVIAFAALAATAYASSNGTVSSASPSYVTTVVTALTTVCPTPTTLTYNSQTYTVTSSTTLTITDCPCTISSIAPPPPPATGTGMTTKPVQSTASTIRSAASSGVTPIPYPTSSNGPTTSVSPPVSQTSSTVATYTGSANKAVVAGGAFVAAVAGLLVV